MTINELLEHYYKNLRESGKSQKIIENIKLNLKDFSILYGEQDSANISNTNLDNYIELLQENDVKNQDQYIEDKLKRLRYFIVFCESRNYPILITSSYITEHEKLIRKSATAYRMSYSGPYLSSSDVEKLILYWNDDRVRTPLLSLRNKALISLFYFEALKPAEIKELKRTDLKGRTLRVGKISIELSEQSSSLLNNYLFKRQDNANELFVGYFSFDTELMKTHPMSVITMRQIVNKAAQDTGFTESISPQILRNSAMIEVILSPDYNYSEFTKRFRLSRTSGAYSRFLPKAKELLGISKHAINATEFSRIHNVPIKKLRKLISSGAVNSVKLHNVHYINPMTEKDFVKVLKSTS